MLSFVLDVLIKFLDIALSVLQVITLLIPPILFFGFIDSLFCLCIFETICCRFECIKIIKNCRKSKNDKIYIKKYVRYIERHILPFARAKLIDKNDYCVVIKEYCEFLSNLKFELSQNLPPTHNLYLPESFAIYTMFKMIIHYIQSGMIRSWSSPTISVDSANAILTICIVYLSNRGYKRDELFNAVPTPVDMPSC